MVVGGGILLLKMLPMGFRPNAHPGQQLRIPLGQMGLDFLPVELSTMHHPGDFLLGEAAGFQLLLKVHLQMIQEALCVSGGHPVPAAKCFLFRSIPSFLFLRVIPQSNESFRNQMNHSAIR